MLLALVTYETTGASCPGGGAELVAGVAATGVPSLFRLNLNAYLATTQPLLTSPFTAPIHPICQAGSRLDSVLTRLHL